MVELIAFFSRRDENYLNGTIRMLDIGYWQSGGDCRDDPGADTCGPVPDRANAEVFKEL